MGTQQLSEDEKRQQEIESKISELENLKQKIYEVMENYTGRRQITTTLNSAAENIQECVNEVEQW